MTTISPDKFLQMISGLDRSKRTIVAIAGAPGSGKSTFAEMLVDKLNRDEAGSAAVLPMDGFHFDDIVLEERGHRPRKGAPHTFDIGGLRATLERLKRNNEAFIASPVFDRSIEIARAGARIIEKTISIIVVEGNYLLLDDPDWTPLREFFDISAYLDEPESILEERLTARWIGFGLEGEAFRAKMEDNDLPNVRLVLDKGGGGEDTFIIRSASAGADR
ncbi:nucleoside/nucleotide kinase family protein [Fulvimarina sp. MAC8]|uniref:nucleoside/nucleotide kinase family protein n=1 Tax=Fulvimarina sp. MAC8 TaxID=3162874 RepID=UPI0032ED73A3